MFLMIYIFAYLFLVLIIGLLGSNRKIGFAGAFFISLILSPLIGLIVVLLSKRLSDLEFEKNLIDLQQQQKQAIDSLSKKGSAGIADEITKLTDLLNRGIINKEEFDKIKLNLLKEADSTLAMDDPRDESELPMITYETNQGEIAIRQRKDQPQVGDKVFNCYKRPHHDVVLKIKNGPRIDIKSNRISRIF